MGAFVQGKYYIFLAGLSILAMAQPSFAGAIVNPHIEIVSAFYGKPGAARVVDITEKLRDLCGPGAQSCSVFCSDSSFGRYKLGHKPICRVTYRCGVDYIRSVEAWREEPVLMRCPERHDEQATFAPASTN